MICPGPQIPARVDEVGVPEVEPVDARRDRKPVEQPFDRELGLVRAESAERTAHRVVGAGRERFDIHVRELVRTAMRIGCRLACTRNDSSRENVHFTGRCKIHAASAVWHWFAQSSLPPNAPPLATRCTTTWC